MITVSVVVGLSFDGKTETLLLFGSWEEMSAPETLRGRGGRHTRMLEQAAGDTMTFPEGR